MSSCTPVLGGIQKIHTDLHSLENQPQSLPNVKAVWERMHSSEPQKLIQLERKGLGTLSCFPNEILKIFFSYFTLEELARMAPVSKDFNDISIQFLQEQEITVHPKKINYHIKNGLFTIRTMNIPNFSGHFQIVEDRLYCGCNNGTIKILDMNTMKTLAILEISTEALFVLPDLSAYFSITCLKIAGNHIYAGLDNGMIAVWNLETLKFLAFMIRSGSAKINYLQISGNNLISGSTTGIIKIWDATTFNLLDTLIGYVFAATEDRLYFVSDTGKIKVYDPKTREPSDVQDHPNRIRFLLIEGDRFISALEKDNNIEILDMKTWKPLAILKGHTGKIYHMQIVEGRLFSRASDLSTKVWDLNTFTCLATLEGDHLCDIQFQVKGNRLFSGFESGFFEIWNFSATLSAALANIAEDLSSPDKSPYFPLGQFKMLPMNVRDEIYAELLQVVSFPKEQDSLVCARQAFFDQNELYVCDSIKVLAIYRYLLKQILHLIEKNQTSQAFEEFSLISPLHQEIFSHPAIKDAFEEDAIAINDWQEATSEQCKQVLNAYLKDMEKNKKMIGRRNH